MVERLALLVALAGLVQGIERLGVRLTDLVAGSSLKERQVNYDNFPLECPSILCLPLSIRLPPSRGLGSIL